MKALLIISLFLVPGLTPAQPPVKLYAYSQESMPGIVPGRNEGRPSVRTEYFIYLRIPKGSKLKPEHLIIKNSLYKIARIDTVKSPVYLEQPEKKLLVPKTNDLVLRIYPFLKANAAVISPSNAALILYYINKGRQYHISKEKWTSLRSNNAL